MGADYVLRWLPRGTHTFEKFLKPSELGAELRRNALELVELKGMVMSPFTRQWSLSDTDLDVNYLLAARKS